MIFLGFFCCWVVCFFGGGWVFFVVVLLLFCLVFSMSSFDVITAWVQRDMLDTRDSSPPG